MHDMIETTQVEVVAEQDDTKPERNLFRKNLKCLLQLAATVIVAILANLYVCRFVVVSGDSMYPTLHDGDLLLMRVAAYVPEQGDILVCGTDEEGLLRGKQIVKRCIATEGQSVLVDYANNTISVDGVVLVEDYVNPEDDPLEAYGRENTIYLIPEGHIFVLGDNRNYSADSRTNGVGSIPVEDVLGGVMLHIPVGAWFDQE